MIESTITDDLFLDIGAHSVMKSGEPTCGDVWTTHRDDTTGRVIAILSDGLGSGIKANLLANMTASMALKFAINDTSYLHYAQVIMETLPVCRIRKIAYATFTAIDCTPDGWIEIVEQGNPRFILLRNGRAVDIEAQVYKCKEGDYRTLRKYHFRPKGEDRIIVFSDGVTESGLGSPSHKLGWRRNELSVDIEAAIEEKQTWSAESLARWIVRKAVSNEPGGKAGDDITCGVIYFRHPRQTILASGPPFRKECDSEYARTIATYEGKKVVCGGTTADIVARELGTEIETDLSSFTDSAVPPESKMDGFDLVTEGILTISAAIKILEGKQYFSSKNAATRMVSILKDSDRIQLLVGTKINEAHQDPTLPVDIEIRRTLMKRLAEVLRVKYLKEVKTQYI